MRNVYLYSRQISESVAKGMEERHETSNKSGSFNGFFHSLGIQERPLSEFLKHFEIPLGVVFGDHHLAGCEKHPRCHQQRIPPDFLTTTIGKFCHPSAYPFSILPALLDVDRVGPRLLLSWLYFASATVQERDGKSP